MHHGALYQGLFFPGPHNGFRSFSITKGFCFGTKGGLVLGRGRVEVFPRFENCCTNSSGHMDVFSYETVPCTWFRRSRLGRNIVIWFVELSNSGILHGKYGKCVHLYKIWPMVCAFLPPVKAWCRALTERFRAIECASLVCLYHFYIRCAFNVGRQRGWWWLQWLID